METAKCSQASIRNRKQIIRIKEEINRANIFFAMLKNRYFRFYFPYLYIILIPLRCSVLLNAHRLTGSPKTAEIAADS